MDIPDCQFRVSIQEKKRAWFVVHSIGLQSQLCHLMSCVILGKLGILSEPSFPQP